LSYFQKLAKKDLEKFKAREKGARSKSRARHQRLQPCTPSAPAFTSYLVALIYIQLIYFPVSSDAWIATVFGSFGAIIGLISLAIGCPTLRAATVAKSELNCIYLNPLILSHEPKLT
jgi:hypothetical protein